MYVIATRFFRAENFFDTVKHIIIGLGEIRFQDISYTG